ncbi:hypothetical protein [Dietzia aurantiaca]|uniref:Uncharacterized protein n=2 Tax=Dietzia aurantiaca TaxID=983873 RepID=A0ABV9PPX7_9ACTN|nr:hypothetical protein [uncultured Dietzia sp.]
MFDTEETVMTLSIKDALAAKGLHPSADELDRIESTWAQIAGLRRDLDTINTADADVAIRNIPGGDHHV